MTTTAFAQGKATASVATRARRRQRLFGVVGAVAAAVALWAVFVHVLGIDVRAPAMGGQRPSGIGPGQVVTAAGLASLAGWATLAGLERLTARAPNLWAGIAVGVLLVSLGGPLSGPGISTANRLALVALHVVVAAVLVPVLHRTSPRRRASS